MKDKNKTPVNEYSEMELEDRLRRIVNWEDRIAKFRYSKDATPEEKAAVEPLTDYFLKIECIVVETKAIRYLNQELRSKDTMRDREEYSEVISNREQVIQEVEAEVAENADFYQRILTVVGMAPESDLRPSKLRLKARKVNNNRDESELMTARRLRRHRSQCFIFGGGGMDRGALP